MDRFGLEGRHALVTGASRGIGAGIAAALDALGSVDILVNNAAVGVRLPTLELDAALIDGLHAVNVRAPLLLIAALLPSTPSPGR